MAWRSMIACSPASRSCRTSPKTEALAWFTGVHAAHSEHLILGLKQLMELHGASPEDIEFEAERYRAQLAAHRVAWLAQLESRLLRGDEVLH